jgi:TonB family protein
MGNTCIPMRFQVFRGNLIVKEETLTDPVIKIGKLASSTLRLDEETVSRMHAIIEVSAQGGPQLIDLGSTRGTTVNGERVNKVLLRSGDQIQFGDSRVIVTFAPHNDNAVATPAPLASTPAAPPTSEGTAAALLLQPHAAALPVPPREPPSPVESTSEPITPTFVSSPTSEITAQVDQQDGERAIEVRSLYRGVVTNTRHLTDATRKSTGGQVTTLVGAGIASVFVGLAVFLSMAVSAGHEKARYEKFLNDGNEARNFRWTPPSPALDVVVFGALALGVSLVYAGLKRRTRTTPNFVIGAGTEADAPVAHEFIAAQSFPLVSAAGSDFLVNVTPNMSGEVRLDGHTVPLAQLVEQRGHSFSLGDRGSARIDCGDTSFLVQATPMPRRMSIPFLVWRWSEQVYNVGTTSALLLFLLMVFSVPPDPKSLSLDLFNADSTFVPILIKPPVQNEEEMPDWLKKRGPEDPGGKGQRHKGDEGIMGKKTSKNKEGLYAIKGPKDNQEQYLAKKLAEENAKSAGILGVIRAAEGSHIASIFGRETALGADSSNILGGLMGSQIGESYGVGGLGLVGSGWGGGGAGAGTLGLGTFGTLGKGGGGGQLSGYGRGVGGLAGHRTKGPDIIPGQATVRGSLDREIIRRIIRRHINEVKFCYESELTKNPTLAGRVSIQFTISGDGQVVASVLQSSSMGNARVESCVVQAVRRWEFPKPERGGIVIVSYPFSFQSGGSGG